MIYHVTEWEMVSRELLGYFEVKGAAAVASSEGHKQESDFDRITSVEG